MFPLLQTWTCCWTNNAIAGYLIRHVTSLEWYNYLFLDTLSQLSLLRFVENNTDASDIVSYKVYQSPPRDSRIITTITPLISTRRSSSLLKKNINKTRITVKVRLPITQFHLNNLNCRQLRRVVIELPHLYLYTTGQPLLNATFSDNRDYEDVFMPDTCWESGDIGLNKESFNYDNTWHLPAVIFPSVILWNLHWIALNSALVELISYS